MSSDLIVWLRPQLDDDERLAKAAGVYGAEWRATEDGIYPSDCSRHPGPILADAYGYTDPKYGDHIARHDPARVLQEVAAKRRIISRVADFAQFDMPAVKAQGASREEWSVVLMARDVLKLLALPYADQPGYQGFYWSL